MKKKVNFYSTLMKSATRSFKYTIKCLYFMSHPPYERIRDITSSKLEKLRRSALRKRVWFRCLSRIERGLINLTIKTIMKPRSMRLINVLNGISDKLHDALKLGFFFHLEMIGRPLAEKIAQVAISWGNNGASEWPDDKIFWRFLGLNTRSSNLKMWVAS